MLDELTRSYSALYHQYLQVTQQQNHRHPDHHQITNNNNNRPSLAQVSTLASCSTCYYHHKHMHIKMFPLIIPVNGCMDAPCLDLHFLIPILFFRGKDFLIPWLYLPFLNYFQEFLFWVVCSSVDLSDSILRVYLAGLFCAQLMVFWFYPPLVYYIFWILNAHVHIGDRIV